MHCPDVSHDLQSGLQSKTQLVLLVIQVAQTVLSHFKQLLCVFKYSPSSHNKHFPYVSQVLQSELQFNTQLVLLF